MACARATTGNLICIKIHLDRAEYSQKYKMEATMRRAFAIGLFTVVSSFVPAFADFAVIQFHSGYCRVWPNTADGPQDGHFGMFPTRHGLTDRFDTLEEANAALALAVEHQVCRNWH
jgi:hypothetical protein